MMSAATAFAMTPSVAMTPGLFTPGARRRSSYAGATPRHFLKPGGSAAPELSVTRSDVRGIEVRPNVDGTIPIFSDETLHMIFDILDPGVTDNIELKTFIGSQKK